MTPAKISCPTVMIQGRSIRRIGENPLMGFLIGKLSETARIRKKKKSFSSMRHTFPSRVKCQEGREIAI